MKKARKKTENLLGIIITIFAPCFEPRPLESTFKCGLLPKLLDISNTNNRAIYISTITPLFSFG